MLGLQNNSRLPAKQSIFKADRNGYFLKVMTSENGQNINPPERLAPIVRTDPMLNRRRAEKLELPNDLQCFEMIRP